jgi:hypothetical protein
LQSLFLMNNRFVQDQAVALADRLENLPPKQQVAKLYEVALARTPTEQEYQLATEFLERITGGNQAGVRRSGGTPERSPARFAGQTNDDDTSGEGSGGMRRGGRFSGSSGATVEQTVTREDEMLQMSPLAIYCQALLSSMEFQLID